MREVMLLDELSFNTLKLKENIGFDVSDLISKPQKSVDSMEKGGTKVSPLLKRVHWKVYKVMPRIVVCS